MSIFELSQSPAVWLTAPSVTRYHHLSHSRLSCTLSFLHPPTLSSLCCYSRHSRWGGMTWSVRCGRTESRCRRPSWGTRPSPGWTAGLGNHGAQNPPSWKKRVAEVKISEQKWQSAQFEISLNINQTSDIWQDERACSSASWVLMHHVVSSECLILDFFFPVFLHTRKIKNRILELKSAIISSLCNFPTVSYQPLTRLNVEQECVNTY